MQRTRERPCMSGEDDVKKCISQCKTYLMALQNSYWEKLLYGVLLVCWSLTQISLLDQPNQFWPAISRLGRNAAILFRFLIKFIMLDMDMLIESNDAVKKQHIPVQDGKLKSERSRNFLISRHNFKIIIFILISSRIIHLFSMAWLCW